MPGGIIQGHLNGKILIVTASTGIAAAFAQQAAAAGAHLVIATADLHSGWELAQQTGAEVWTGDLSLPNSAESVLAQCLSKFGRVDGLFNAAGLSGRRFGDGPAHECSDEGWDLTLAQNLGIMFRMCRAVIGRMLQQEPGENGIHGAILNMGSVLAEAPEPRHFATHAYAAAKGAVTSMTRSMAAYYAPHKIRVNAIAPGLVRTAVSERAQGTPELLEFIAKKQPLAGGMVDAVDVAQAALFLLGNQSRFITGEVLTVDAGWSVTGV
jgi:NAD(P)-dependent dehydrogenase (short-subunit alcohol dehydrogenase family)